MLRAAYSCLLGLNALLCLSYCCYYMALVLPALMFLKVVISVVGSGLMYCTWVSTVSAVIVAAVTGTKLS